MDSKSLLQSLAQKIESRNAKIGILGIGYVGLPLMLRYAEVGFKVVGFDPDRKKVDSFNRGESYLKHFTNAQVSGGVKNGAEATTDFSKASEIDAFIICVPTPLNKFREPDLGYIQASMNSILPYIRKGTAVSLESTSYPGTTEEEVLAPLEKKGFTAGVDVAVIFSPEREDPGNPNFTTRTIPKVISGHTPACLQVATALYQGVVDRVVPVSSLKVAEMTKITENVHRAVNIGLVNELKIVADKMGIDIFEVIKAASSKPFGFTPYYPGPGLGGHCIPIDPFYLTYKAREYGVSTKFIELAGEVNCAMPDFVIQKTIDGLNRAGVALSKSKILILGLAYKKNIDDVRESPSLKIMETLLRHGAEVDYHDPYVPEFPSHEGHFYVEKSSVALTPATVKSYDAVLLVTQHDVLPYEMLLRESKLVIDTRGSFPTEKNVLRA